MMRKDRNKEKIPKDLVNKVFETFTQNVAINIKKDLKPFLEAFAIAGDREMAIISGTLIDNYLEQVFVSYFIKDNSVKSIFKDAHVLQSLYSKIQIAYCSGLIPRWIYYDLKAIGEIRNRFAHQCMPMLKFKDAGIKQKINRCVLRSKTLDDINNPRLQFMLITLQIAWFLFYTKALLDIVGQESVVDRFWGKDIDPEKFALSKDEIKNIIKNLNAQEEQQG